jgi:hypothetical protein
MLPLAVTVEFECGNLYCWEFLFGCHTGIYKKFSRARYLEFLARYFVWVEQIFPARCGNRLASQETSWLRGNRERNLSCSQKPATGVIASEINRDYLQFLLIIYYVYTDLPNFMFCWPWISMYSYAFNETNLMHCLSSVYSVTITLRVSALLVAHHQEVTTYVFFIWNVLYVLVYYQLAWLEWNSIPTRVWCQRPDADTIPRRLEPLPKLYTCLWRWVKRKLETHKTEVNG